MKIMNKITVREEKVLCDHKEVCIVYFKIKLNMF